MSGKNTNNKKNIGKMRYCEMLVFNFKKEELKKIKSSKNFCKYELANGFWQSRIYNLIRKYDTKMCAEICKLCMKDKTGRGNFSIALNKTCIIKLCLEHSQKNNETEDLFAKITRLSRLSNGIFTDLKANKPVFEISFKII